MSEAAEGALRGPSTYAELKSERARFAILYFVILASAIVLGCLVQFFMQLLGMRPGEELSIVAILTLTAIPRPALSTLVGIFAARVGMRSPGLVALLALLPVVSWVVFFMVVGFVPKPFEAEIREAEAAPDWVRWLAFVVLWPFLMAKLFAGPPWIPGLEGTVACGWPFLGLALLLMALAMTGQWVGFWKGKVRGGWLALLVLIMHIYFVFPTVYIILLGPAIITVAEEFFLGGVIGSPLR